MAAAQDFIEPTSLAMVHYPDPRLRAKAGVITQINGNVRDIALAMIDMMFKEDGVGLAAPQVGVPWRLFVLDVPAETRYPKPKKEHAHLPSCTDGPIVCINPLLSKPTGPVERAEEGCLSLPDIRGEVIRPPVITLDALDIEGNPFTLTSSGLLARCIQHEFDHLEGVLIIDRMLEAGLAKSRRMLKALEDSYRPERGGRQS
jgi:peptide deformylase